MSQEQRPTTDMESPGKSMDEESVREGSTPAKSKITLGGKSSETPDIRVATQTLLSQTLENLSGNDFKKFKDKLLNISFSSKNAIPQGELENADICATWKSIRKHYGEDDALELTMQALSEANMKVATKRLMAETYSWFAVRKHSMRTIRTILFYTLINLSKEDFMKFKYELLNFTSSKTPDIPEQLKEADCIDTAKHLIQLYGQEEALEVTGQVLSAVNLKEALKNLTKEIFSWLSRKENIKNPRVLLFNALTNLTEEDFEQFKGQLQSTIFRGKPAISPPQLENAQCYGTWKRVIEHYGEEDALDVTIQALFEIRLKEAAKRLIEEAYSWFTRIESVWRRPRILLFHTLKKLTEEEFTKFKDRLNNITYKEKAKQSEQLSHEDCYDIWNCLIRLYGEDDALKVTSHVLSEVGLSETVKRLMEETYSYIEDKDIEARCLEIAGRRRSTPLRAEPWMDCALCGMSTDSDNLQVEPTRDGSTYRIELNSRGLFCCSETGIKFQVTSPVTIEYELDSWQNHMKKIYEKKYEIVGPLFNIKTKTEPGVVSAVYLPHYVCLKGGNVDLSRFHIGHFKDDNMILETATRIEPYYVVLENPNFSSLGPLFMLLPKALTNLLPIHGFVLIYCKWFEGCTIHLYLLPDDFSVKKVVDEKEEKNTFRRIDKPPQTKALYIRNAYFVEGPPNASVNPKTLKLGYYQATELYPFSDIYLREYGSDVELKILHEKSGCEIWNAQLRKEEIGVILPSSPTGSTPTETACFVEKNYINLCRRIGLLAPILLALREKRVINQEEEDMINTQPLKLEKNKALLTLIVNKNATKEFCNVLKDNDPFLVEDLDQPT